MAIQEQLAQTQQQLAVIDARTAILRNKIDRNKSESRELNELSEQYTQLQTRLNILRTSQTSEEAAQRERIFQANVTRQQTQQTKPQGLTAFQQRVASGYERSGFSSQEAAVLARASEAQRRSFTKQEAEKVLRQEKTYSSYIRAGYSAQQASVLAGETEARKQSLTPKRAEQILQARQVLDKPSFQFRIKEPKPPTVSTTQLPPTRQQDVQRYSVYDVDSNAEIEAAQKDASIWSKVKTNVRTSETYPQLFQGVYESTGTGRYVREKVAPRFPLISFIGGQAILGVKKGSRYVSTQSDKAILKLHGLEPTEENIAARRSRIEQSGVEQDINVLLLAAGSTPKAFASAQFKVVEPVRQREKAKGIQVKETYILEGSPITSADYKIYTEVQPPRVSYVTSLKREQAGLAPKQIKYLPEITKVTKTPFKAFGDEPFAVLETKTGKVGTASLVEGASRRFDIVKYKELSAPEKFLAKRLAESKAGGRPISDDFILKILKPKELRYISDIDVTKFSKLYKQPKIRVRERGVFQYPYEYFKPGRRTTRFKAITEITPLKETDLYSLQKEKTLFLDVTKAPSTSPRRNTITQELNTLSFEYKEPKIISMGKDVTVIRPADIIKTPLDKTFQVLQQRQLFIPPPLPKTPKAITRTTTISKPISESQITIPASAYAGTGLYERTGGGLLPKQFFGSSPKLFETPSFTMLPKEKLTSPTKAIEKSILRYVQKPITKEISKAVPKEITKEVLKPQLKVAQKTTQKLLQKLIQKPISKTPPYLIPRMPRLPRTPKKPFLIPNLGRGARLPRNLFRVSVRRRGKFMPVGVEKDILKATNLGRDITQRGLGQTFKIESLTGKPINIGIPKGYYRKPSRKGILFIEKPRAKINLPSEKQLLAAARAFKLPKMKGGKRK